jgi:hypothetical protein
MPPGAIRTGTLFLIVDGTRIVRGTGTSAGARSEHADMEGTNPAAEATRAGLGVPAP